MIATTPRTFAQEGVTFDAATHVYTYRGTPVAHHVTGVLRAHKISADWSHIDVAVLERKRQLGAAVHAVTHYLDEGDFDVRYFDQVPETEPYAQAWGRAKRELGIDLLLLETALVHPVWICAGMVDRLAILRVLHPNGAPSVLDIKLGDPEDAGAGPQTAAYEQLIRATTSPASLGAPELAGVWDGPWVRYSIQLLPNGTYRLTPYTSHRDLLRFQWALSLEASAHPSWKKARV